LAFGGILLLGQAVKKDIADDIAPAIADWIIF